MEKDQLKENILERIDQIDDMNMLNAIHTILNKLDSGEIDFDDVNEALEKEDFSGYIKEWVKNM